MKVIEVVEHVVNTFQTIKNKELFDCISECGEAPFFLTLGEYLNEKEDFDLYFNIRRSYYRIKEYFQTH